ncbi:GNAT family N-acetyltransferase [Longibacter salinarum]|uniref:GNAT family N-acetyltransferase n=1 Tax=Longibacter salinarum TaxID=1850348 RepID=UPI0015CF3431|nr:GNAT family N-acetyltransferase [Longibacter salinarum]
MRDSLSLDPVRLYHAGAIQRLASHPKIAETTNIPQPYPKDGAASWIISAMPRQMAGVEYSFAIMREDDDTLVGVTSLMNVGQGEAELGYWIGYPYWGNGYATKANRLVLEFAFESVCLDTIYARPLLRNAASCRVLDKLGFDLVDVVENVFPKWDNTDSLGMYEIEKVYWSSRCNSAESREGFDNVSSAAATMGS